MEYFELPQLKVNSEEHIDAIDKLEQYFRPVSLKPEGHQVVYEGVSEDANPDDWTYYQDLDHDANFDSNPLVEKICQDACKILNLPRSKVVRRQYTKMKPGWSLNIHRDVARQVALLVEFVDAKGDITWYNDKREPTKTLVYGPPVVVNTRQLHSARANDIKRFGFQIDFDYLKNLTSDYK